MNKRVYYGLLLVSTGTSACTIGALASNLLMAVIGGVIVSVGSIMVAKQ